MALDRLLPDRWLHIAAWTATAVVWGTTAVAASSAASGSEDHATREPERAAVPVAQPSPTTTQSPMPVPPENGLIVIRYTPVEPPAPQVITRTVSQSAAPTVAQPAPTVQSSGS